MRARTNCRKVFRMLQSTFNYKDFLKTSAKGLDPADKQMAFQGIMSDTAHQREIADLKASGLNPVLSASGGSGASSPSGAYDAEQEMKDMMALTAQSVGTTAKIASKAIDNSGKTVNNTVGKLISGDLTVHKENPLGTGPVSGIDYSGRPGFFKPLQLLNSRPMDVYAHPRPTGRSLSTAEGRWNADKSTFEDMKAAYKRETGRDWYDDPPYVGKLPTSVSGFASMVDYLPKIYNSGYSNQKRWLKKNQKEWKKHMSEKEWKNYVYWMSVRNRG